MDDQRIADYFIVAGYEENAEPLKVTDETEANAKANIKDPITDLAVINRTAGETIPEGFTCVERTPGGTNADLNFGSFRCPELYLCYQRGRSKPPLVHIGVLFEGRDRLLHQCEIIRETPEGRCANVNNTNSSRSFITFKRASPRCSPNDLVVTDVCIVIKDEKAPHTYWKIGDRNLNNALLGSDVFLCYKKATVNTNYVTYQPSLLFRYPKNEYSSLPLPLDIQLFSMPMGASLEAWPKEADLPRAVFAKFVLTVSGNRSQVYSGGKLVQKLYGAAMSFYEPFPKEKLKAEQLKELTRNIGEDGVVFYANKSICILSRWPFYDAFQTFLQHLLLMSFSSHAHSVSMERVIAHLIHEVPFPSVHRPKVLMQLAGSSVPIPLTRPDDSPIPLNGSSFNTMLKNLSAENCVTILLLSLMEQKICLHSLRPDVLTAVAESVTSMIFPFVWQCPYIPLCPLGLCGLLHAPVPFIVGVDSRYFDLYDPPLDIIYVDLDTNSIEMPKDKHDFSLKMVPKKAMKLLLEKLEKINAKMHDEAARTADEKKKLRNSDTIPGEKEFKQRVKTRQFDAEIQEAYLWFMVSILKGYRTFLKPMTRAPTEGATDPGALFDIPGFLKSRERSHFKFFDLIIRTQQFIRFIEERSIMSDRDASYGMAFFDDCVDRVEKEGLKDVRLIDAEDILNERTVFIPPPEPDDTSDSFTYGKCFPELRYDLFGDAVTLSNNDIPEVGDREVARTVLPSGDLVTSRTKQEIRTSQVFAQYAHQRPKHWAKYLLSTGYAIWFMYLPSFVASSNSHSRTLRNAFETLKRMLSAKIQPSDEVCYRIVMQLCGQYCQPALAVKVLFEMKNHKILPDAVTYGYYNKVVFESMWPVGSRTPYMLWMKLRHVIRAVTLFSQAGIHQREKIQAKSEETDGISGGQHLAADGLSLNGDDKGNTRGSSDTGFFSLDSEGKRNSMMSLTSGEFMAPIAELKPIGTKIITSVDSSAPTVDTIANCTVEVNGVSTSGDCDISTLQTSSICRKPTDMLRLPSAATPLEPDNSMNIDFCSAGVLMVSQKHADDVFRESPIPEPSVLRHRRHRSLNIDPRRTSLVKKKRHFSTSVVGISPTHRLRRPSLLSSKGVLRRTPTPLVTEEPARLPVPNKLPISPPPSSSNETVVVLEESVVTTEISSPMSDEDDDEQFLTEPRRRNHKSMSVPREDGMSESSEYLSRLSLSTSAEFASSTLPKLGAFIRNTKSYSSIRRFWSPAEKRKTKECDAVSIDSTSTSSTDASPLVKGSAALVSGVKSMTSALGKKLGELSTTLTTASSESGSPLRMGSSLRDLPGALSFGDYAFDTYAVNDIQDWRDEGEDRMSDAVDAGGAKGWEFPTYTASAKHTLRVDGASGHPESLVIVHVDMTSVMVCQRCHTGVYDEEILAGYWPDESNLNAKCPYCATKFLPELSATIFDHSEEDPENTATESFHCCPNLKTSSKSLSNISTADRRASSHRTSTENVMDQQAPEASTNVSEEPNDSAVVPVIDIDSAETSDRSSAVDPCGEDGISQTNSFSSRVNCCRLRETVKVPYLSPLVLRKELETLIANAGDTCLMDSDMPKSHDIVYWNLLWYCERLNLPQNLTGMLVDQRVLDLLTSLGHSLASSSKSRFVAVSCRWDRPELSPELGTPMYLSYGQTESQSPQLNVLGTDDHIEAIPKNLMGQMLIRIRDNSDLSSPMKIFLHEMRKRPEPRHRSMYRELLFLAIRALDSENIDRIAFDTVYKTAFNSLRKEEDFIGILQADDRPPSLGATWCRQAFRPMEI